MNRTEQNRTPVLMLTLPLPLPWARERTDRRRRRDRGWKYVRAARQRGVRDAHASGDAQGICFRRLLRLRTFQRGGAEGGDGSDDGRRGGVWFGVNFGDSGAAGHEGVFIGELARRVRTRAAGQHDHRVQVRLATENM